MEIVVLVQSDYGVRIGSEATSREMLQSLTSLADYVRANREG
jgi:acyl carrier protein